MIKTHIFISYARSDASEVASLLQRRLEGVSDSAQTCEQGCSIA